MPLDHIGIHVDAKRHLMVKEWYEKALKPVGYQKFRTEGENEEIAGFSYNAKNCEWWVLSAPEPPNLPMHFAFRVDSKRSVHGFIDSTKLTGCDR